MIHIIIVLSGIVMLTIYSCLRPSIPRFIGPRHLPLPPGPPSLPFIGNMFAMPRTRPWVGLRKLSAHYGKIMFLRVLNRPMLILSDADIISEFLEKQSAHTSSRLEVPSITMTGFDWALTFMPIGPTWRFYRRLFTHHFNPSSMLIYRDAQRAASRRFLNKLLMHPDLFLEHVQFAISASILKIAYGFDMKNDNDPILAVYRRDLEGVQHLLVTSGFLVDAFPILQHYPTWLPGGGFKQQFARMREACIHLMQAPFEQYQALKSSTELPGCIVTDIIEKDALRGSSGTNQITREDAAMHTAATIFFAGSETTVSVVEVFFLAMSLYPDVQKNAQAELDMVVGRERLPDFEDRPSLPYISALILECLRWMPILPLGVSHLTTCDTELEGYGIPEGTLVLANIWACMHDPQVFDEPGVFRPERFIRNGQFEHGVQSPEELVFGFGRRICPGKGYAQSSLFINIASVLHMFDITSSGNGVRHLRPEMLMRDSFASRPDECRCTIKPRGPWAAALILSACHPENEKI